MHQISELSQFNIGEITKIEGSAGLDVTLADGKVTSVHFKIDEFKRFYTTAMQGKPVAAIPQLLARICGTCSNAHLLASIEAVEHTLGIIPSDQTRLLRELTYHGLIIRDHALHLYIFALPDVFGKDSLLEFDDHDPVQHQLLHDAFAVKGAGNHLAILVAGRSVHAPFPMPGGFAHIPMADDIQKSIDELKTIRPAVLRLIDTFLEIPFSLTRATNYLALVSPDFSYLEGRVRDMHDLDVDESGYRDLLEHVVIPYSHASGYVFQGNGEQYRVGAIARLNLNKNALHAETQKDAALALKVFPSHNIFHNNLAQAIAILHSIDRAIDLLTQTKFVAESPQKLVIKAGIGVGVVEAPRGTLYHKLEVGADGKVIKGEVIVPTGQNQIAIEADLKQYIEANLDKERDEIALGCERIIRAYDPCMSCASHFLKVNWVE
ncbi:MAG: nickel-dependent hydrogenase large subunit [Candidatus Moraniibacteriota bacterium]